ncbi:MAG: hypothetical protein HOC79_00925 [Euryarchaeota archaeon]|nr:hypothetical protein [Euryarchaeota archaeon]
MALKGLITTFKFRPITHSDYDTLTEYWDILSKTRKHPRFYQSPLRLMQQKGVFKMGFVNGCLCILKARQIMGHPVCYLMLPPISKTMSKLDEINTMVYFKSQKISTMLSEEDNDYYFGEGNEMGIEIDKGNAEYCYTLESLGVWDGVNKNQLRRAKNQTLRAMESHGIKVECYNTHLPLHLIDKCIDLTARWKEQGDKKGRGIDYHIRNFNKLFPQANDNQLATIIYDKERVYGYLISERVGDGIINNAAFIEKEDSPLKHTTNALLLWSAKWWLDEGWWIEGNTIVNRGAAVRGKGSVAAKKKLRPVFVNQNYKLITEKMSKSEYKDLFVSGVKAEWL